MKECSSNHKGVFMIVASDWTAYQATVWVILFLTLMGLLGHMLQVTYQWWAGPVHVSALPFEGWYTHFTSQKNTPVSGSIFVFMQEHNKYKVKITNQTEPQCWHSTEIKLTSDPSDSSVVNGASTCFSLAIWRLIHGYRIKQSWVKQTCWYNFLRPSATEA